MRERLEDAEKLRLFSRVASEKQKALESSLEKAQAASQVLEASLEEAKFEAKRWEGLAGGEAERASRAEGERDAARREASTSRLAAEAAGDAKARVDDELARVRISLINEEERGREAKAEIARLKVEYASLQSSLEEHQREAAVRRSQEEVERKKTKEDYLRCLEDAFAYGYGCCAFAHNIRNDQPAVPSGMPPFGEPLPASFFEDPRCPPGSAGVGISAGQDREPVGVHEADPFTAGPGAEEAQTGEEVGVVVTTRPADSPGPLAQTGEEVGVVVTTRPADSPDPLGPQEGEREEVDDLAGCLIPACSTVSSREQPALGEEVVEVDDD